MHNYTCYFVLATVKESGWALQYAREELQDDKEILEAINDLPY